MSIEVIPELDAPGLRKFGLMMAGFIVIIFGLLLPFLSVLPYSVIPWILASLFVVIAVIAPLRLNGFYKLWMKFGQAMGTVVNTVILGTVYLVMVTPLGLVMRLFGWDSLRRRLDGDVDTYRIESRKRDRQELERPF